MNRRRKLLSLFALLLPVSLGFGSSLGIPDLSARLAEIDQKRVPLKMHEGIKMHGMEKNKQFSDKQFPIKSWESEYNSLGRKRAPIAVEEKNAKDLRRPKVVEMKKFDTKMAPENRRRAFLRNGDQAKEKNLTPRYRDANVTHIDELSRPAMSPYAQKGEPSMREINRFSFQRNHDPEAGAKVDRAGVSEKKN